MGIGYIAVRRIPFRCSECLRKIASPWSRSKYKYNQYQYKGDNQNCVYWTILWSFKKWKIIHCIPSRKEKSSDTDINFHIKQHSIRNVALQIGKNISDNDYGEISKIEKYRKWILSC